MGTHGSRPGRCPRIRRPDRRQAARRASRCAVRRPHRRSRASGGPRRRAPPRARPRFRTARCARSSPPTASSPTRRSATRLYRGRHVIWLDVPADRLMERLRAARREDIGIAGDLRTFIHRHLAEYQPYYARRRRGSTPSGSLAAAIADDRAASWRIPLPPGTLILRAEVHGGLLELGDGILGPEPGARPRAAGGPAVRRGHHRRQPTRWRTPAVAMVRAAGGRAGRGRGAPRRRAVQALEQQEPLFRRLAALRLERGDPLIALGDDALLESGDVRGRRLAARRPARRRPGHDPGAHRHGDRRQGRDRPAGRRAQPARGDPPAGGHDPRRRRSWRTSRRRSDARRWPRP